MAEEISYVNTPKRRGATRHCCYGLCKSDSRYQDRDYMHGVKWIVFPKPHKDYEKCLRWTRACGRENFTPARVTKWTYICSKHFVAGDGPTADHPDPIPAVYTPDQVSKLSRKRKPPTPRANPVSKKMLLEASDALLSLGQDLDPTMENSIGPDNDLMQIADQVHSEDQPHIETSDKCTSTNFPSTEERETQTNYVCSDKLASKINNIVTKNSSKERQANGVKVSFQESFCYESVSKDIKKFHFYTGLTVLQFMHLFSCLGSEPESLNYWKGSKTSATGSCARKRPEKKISAKDQLFMTLIKLRQAFPNQDLAYRFGVSVSTVSKIVNTWIQYLFKKTEGIRNRQFPSRLLIKQHLPSCFHSFKNVRIIIDCFEIFVQSSQDFAEQGNMYSSYKHHTTLKCLVGIAPSGGITFLSDTYEGSISDKDIVAKSGLVDRLDPGDLVIADRGFLIKDILQQRRVELNIPPFLCGRSKLTAQEEILTKRIARVRIHVERAIERMKKFKIIGRVIPLSLKPVVTQIVHVVGFLVNYQEPLVK